MKIATSGAITTTVAVIASADTAWSVIARI
jgi:hypothetical protein